jgi:hypothetical protein
MGKDWSKGKQFVSRSRCFVCNEEFYAAPCIRKRSVNSGKYCSRKCRGIDQSKVYQEENKDKIQEIKACKIKKETVKKENKKIREYKKSLKIINKCNFCGKDTTKIYCDRKCYISFKKVT